MREREQEGQREGDSLKLHTVRVEPDARLPTHGTVNDDLSQNQGVDTQPTEPPRRPDMGFFKGDFEQETSMIRLVFIKKSTMATSDRNQTQIA